MTYVATIVDQMSGIEKHRKSFLKVLVAVFCTLVGKATAANLARFGICEKRIRRWFHKPFDWQSLHIAALKHAGVLENKLLACIDATFISKAGKHTDDIGSFYNGKVGRSERGCEAIHLSLLDACEHTAYTLACELSPTLHALPLEPARGGWIPRSSTAPPAANEDCAPLQGEIRAPRVLAYAISNAHTQRQPHPSCARPLPPALLACARRAPSGS